MQTRHHPQRIIFLCEKAEQLSPTLAAAFKKYLDENGKAGMFEVKAIGAALENVQELLHPDDILLTIPRMVSIVREHLERNGVHDYRLVQAPFFMVPKETHPFEIQRDYSDEKRQLWGDGVLEQIRLHNSLLNMEHTSQSNWKWNRPGNRRHLPPHKK